MHEGAIYYAASKRRRIVHIDAPLRARVTETATQVRGMLASGVPPPPTQDERRCRICSLETICQPDALRRLREGDAAAAAFDPER